MYNCRLCSSPKQTLFLNLGFTPLADQFKRKEQLTEPEIYYPLEVVICDKCDFVQLNHVVSPEVLYRNDYPYESSITETGKIHFLEFAKSVKERYSLKKNDLAVDIGSNVGVLLSGFKACGLRVLGIDPAPNIVRIAENNGICTLPEFFSKDVALQVVKKYGQANVITASNVFAHVDNLNAFMQAVHILLENEGVLIIESPHLGKLIKNIEYDTIYHEHLSYLSLKPLMQFFSKNGFEVIEVEVVDIHGGSFRMSVARVEKYPVSETVPTFLNQEESQKIHDRDVLHNFARKVEYNRRQLIWLLRKLKHNSKRIAAVSAPAKGMTLLNYCHIGIEILDFVTEKSTLKIGRFTPGGHIPVLPDDALIKEDIDYALLLAWNFQEEIIHNLSLFKDKGGKFIIPIPDPVILD